jgi:hypothetical protein
LQVVGLLAKPAKPAKLNCQSCRFVDHPKIYFPAFPKGHHSLTAFGHVQKASMRACRIGNLEWPRKLQKKH